MPQLFDQVDSKCDRALDRSNSVLDELLRHRNLPVPEARNYLAQYLFRGEDVYKPVGALSGGTRQKLNLTLALMHDPSVLLLDEPYQGFDWETYLHFWDLVVDLRERGCAVLVISHLVFDRERFDCLYHLARGTLIHESTTEVLPDVTSISGRHAVRPAGARP